MQIKRWPAGRRRWHLLWVHLSCDTLSGISFGKWSVRYALQSKYPDIFGPHDSQNDRQKCGYTCKSRPIRREGGQRLLPSPLPGLSLPFMQSPAYRTIH